MGPLGVFFCVLVAVAVVVLAAIALVRRAKHNQDSSPWLTKRKLAEQIDAIDLSMVEQKLRDRDWADFRVYTAVLEYRKFLFLAAINQRELITPWNDDIDDCWRKHSELASYGAVCQKLFGESWPYLPPTGGLRPTNDKQQSLYDQTFRTSVQTDRPNGDILLQVWVLDELLNDPTPISYPDLPISEFYVDPYAGHGGEFGGGGASGDWNDSPTTDTDTGRDSSGDDCSSNDSCSDSSDSGGGYDSGSSDCGGGESGGCCGGD